MKDIKKVAIIQSNYIPWKGYFDIINSADAFVVYDEVQYTKNDWRNRNLIKTPNGREWITIPVRHNKLNHRICEISILSPNWKDKHLKTLQSNYARAKCFDDVKKMVFDWYSIDSDLLSEINRHFIENICSFLNINTLIIDSRDLNLKGDRNERLVEVCKKLGAEVYLSGPTAKSYLDKSMFSQEGIQVDWMDYSGYKEYDQLYPPFENNVSILDLIFNTGKEASNYMKSFFKK